MKEILRKHRKRLIKIAVVFVLAILFLIVSVYLEISYRYKEYTFYNLETAPKSQVVMILGARVYSQERLSPIYYDRVNTALEIYKADKADKILISGDHGREEYDEVNAAKNYLLKKGVDASDIFLDHAGFDTYDSMYRARDIFEVSNLLVVTQNFHLPRAVYIARRLGIEASGVSADKRTYRDALRNDIRESLARVKAMFNIVFRSKPTFLGEPIPVSGESKLSWD